MDAPKRVWLDWPAANRGDPVYDEPPERDTQPGQLEYIAAPEVQAMIAAAVAEERERCARIAWDYEDVYGGRGLDGMAKCARNIARAIRAATPLPATEP